ncbi:hypothetical protein CEXT_727221 [Caerostris extrusa]|uniref:Uncharacterized protein n=1 Tax=Caerostris extrusa TaxID=172846 RepID=A0AAV4PP83_CAEEX|nr:hypothetical protein CEXT_727221 [Caerostris extrusa]
MERNEGKIPNYRLPPCFFKNNETWNRCSGKSPSSKDIARNQTDGHSYANSSFRMFKNIRTVTFMPDGLTTMDPSLGHHDLPDMSPIYTTTNLTIFIEF